MLREPILEPIARLLRFGKTIEFIKGKKITIVDIGCGPEAKFYRYLKENGLKSINYIGIDPFVKNIETKKIKLIKTKVDKEIPLSSNIANYVVAHAVIEHVDYPEKLISEMIRITKPGGKVIITTPTPRSKKILEILSFKFGLISKREIKEHKNYFNKERLMNIVKRVNNIDYEHHYFELGFNNLTILSKIK